MGRWMPCPYWPQTAVNKTRPGAEQPPKVVPHFWGHFTHRAVTFPIQPNVPECTENIPTYKEPGQGLTGHLDICDVEVLEVRND